MTSPQTFKAATVQQALALVKQTLGPNAVIVGTRRVGPDAPGPRGAAYVEITAAPPPPSGSAQPPRRVRRAAGPFSPVTSDLPHALYPQYLRLVQQEVAEDLARELVRRAAAIRAAGRAGGDDALPLALREAIRELVPVSGGIRLQEGRTLRVALVGPAGAGKTTTLAKLAAHFRLRLDRRVALLSVDMHRLATHDELRRYAELIGVPFQTAQTPDAVRQALARLTGAELVLIDTPGVSVRERERFAQLAALLESARPHEIHLVLPASLAPKVQERVAGQFAALEVSRVVLTRLDEVLGLGAVLGAVRRLNWGVSYLCDGQRVPNDLREACPADVCQLLFGV